MNQELLKIERSVRDRNDSDKVLINWWLYFFLLSWITLGIMSLVLLFQRITRVDKFINRKKSYFEGLISYSEQTSKDKNKYDELSTQINKLKDVYEHEFLQKNKLINAGLFLFLGIVFYVIGWLLIWADWPEILRGIHHLGTTSTTINADSSEILSGSPPPTRSWGLYLLDLLQIIFWLVVTYKLNKAWDNLQRAEQKFYDELNPILTKLELIKYPINFRIKSNKSRNFILYIFLSIITFGIWTIVWDYRIHTDPDDLYPEFHAAEDYVLGAVKQ